MLNKKKQLTQFNCFENIKVDYSDNVSQDHIQETINKDKNFLLNFFEKQPYFKELMPNIKKAGRGTLYYHGLIKKGLEFKTDFFKAILRAIEKVKEENKNKSPKLKPKIRLYKLPKIKELKIKKQRIDDINVQKIKLIELEKEKFDKYKEQVKKFMPNTTVHSSNNNKKLKNIFSDSTPNIFFNGNSNIINKNNYNTNNSFYKNMNITKLSQNSLLTPKNDISTYYKSNNFKNLSRNDSFLSKTKLNANNVNDINNLLNKCIEEITSGKEVKGKVSKYNKHLSRTIQKKLKTGTNNNIKIDKKIIEDKKYQKNKYIKLEENNYANIKKKLNQKISYSLAYQNRKELYELFKSNKHAKSYTLHLNEMNKINKVMEKKRIIERKKINKVKSLCNLGYQENEFINKQMDKINNKNKELNKLDKSMENIPNDDSFSVKNNKNILKGSLLQNLLSFKDSEYKVLKDGNTLKKDNY